MREPEDDFTPIEEEMIRQCRCRVEAQKLGADFDEMNFYLCITRKAREIQEARLRCDL